MKTAIITGGGTGIGRATALRLAAEGFSVALIGRTAATLEESANAVRAKRSGEDGGGSALAIVGDASLPEDCERAVGAVMEKWKRVDVLVNCAGYAPLILTHAMPVEQWRRVIENNLSCVFYAVRAAWPAMASTGDGKAQGGVIVNVSSMASRDPFMGLGVYGAAKAGVNMLTLALAREGATVGIRVVGVAPAAVDTGMFQALVGAGNVNPAEVLRPEDVAEVIASAVTDGAAALRYASGETVFVHRRPA